ACGDSTMTKLRLITRVLLLLGAGASLTVPATAQAPAKIPDQTPAHAFDSAAAARRAWAVMDLVQQHHPEPCARQDMIQGGVEALLAQVKLVSAKDLRAHVKMPPAEDLARQVQAVGSVEELAALLEAV